MPRKDSNLIIPPSRFSFKTKKVAAGQAARRGENEKVLGLFVGMYIE